MVRRSKDINKCIYRKQIKICIAYIIQAIWQTIFATYRDFNIEKSAICWEPDFSMRQKLSTLRPVFKSVDMC